MYGNGTMGMFALLMSPYLSKVHTEIFPHETVLSWNCLTIIPEVGDGE